MLIVIRVYIDFVLLCSLICLKTYKQYDSKLKNQSRFDLLRFTCLKQSALRSLWLVVILPLFGLVVVLSFVMVYTERLVLSLHFSGSREWSEFFGQISKQCEAKSKQSSFSCELFENCRGYSEHKSCKPKIFHFPNRIIGRPSYWVLASRLRITPPLLVLAT